MLIDTTVIIDLTKGNEDAAHFINTALHQETIYISIITMMEVLVGARNKRELKSLSELMHLFKAIPLDDDTGVIALGLIKTYCLSHSLGIPDALIAASALNSQTVVYTKNIKHFSMIPQLDVRRPY